MAVSMARSGWWLLAAASACGDVGNAADASPDATLADARIVDAPPLDAARCVAGPASLRARWRGDGDAAEVTGAYPGTAVGGVGFAAGTHGTAFAFDGVDDAITADPADQLWPVGSFSVEAWVKLTVLEPGVTYAPIVGKYDCGGADQCGASHWFLYVTDAGLPHFEIRVPGTTTASATATTTTIVDGAWHHLVGVRDVAQRQLALYVDGAVAVTVPLAPAFLGAMTDDGASDPVTIGAGRASGTNALTFEFVGAIDDPAYYIEALAPAQIAAAAAAPDGYCP